MKSATPIDAKSAKRKPIDIAKARDLLDYSPSTGALTWKKTGAAAGCVRGGKYRVIRLAGSLYYAHRIALAIHSGEDPDGVVDHINGDGLDNRAINLRAVSVRVNSQNTRKAHSDSESGFLGVQRNHKAWQAIICTGGKRTPLGTFKTPEEAHAAYLIAKAKKHSDSAIAKANELRKAANE